MKNYLIILMLIVPFIFGCMGDSEKVQRLEAKLDSIQRESNEKDKINNEFFQAFNEIEENLKLIKEKEKIIRVDVTQEELSPNVKERINDDILEIYKYMLENKSKLKTLEKKLSRTGARAGEFKKAIDNLTSQLEEKGQQIEQLKNELAKAHIDIKNLNLKISDMSDNIDSLAKANETKENIIDEKTTELNTAYYVFGNKKELKKHGVITKEGGFIGIGRMSKLKDNFNKSYFTKIDIRVVNEIPIKSKKAKVITSHPASSYELSGDKVIDKLVIKDPQEFWSVSKYLVIVVD